MADGILEASADALFGDGVQVTLGQNGVDDLNILFASLRGNCQGGEESRSARSSANKGKVTWSKPSLRDILSKYTVPFPEQKQTIALAPMRRCPEYAEEASSATSTRISQ